MKIPRTSQRAEHCCQMQIEERSVEAVLPPLREHCGTSTYDKERCSAMHGNPASMRIKQDAHCVTQVLEPQATAYSA